MPQSAVRIDVDINGPFLTGQPADKLHDALSDTLHEVMLRSEREVTQMAQPAPSGLFHTRDYAQAHGYFQTGHYNRSINGRMVDSMHGVISDSGVVYGPWLEGVSSMNQRTRFKGYHIFRKAAEKIQAIADDILQRNITRLKAALD